MSEPFVLTPEPTNQPVPSVVPEVPVLPSELVAPGDLAPVPKRWERLAWYAGSMILSAVLVSAGLRLDSQDLHAPFYYDLDSLLYLPLVKNTIDHGTHWRNDRMGEPGVQELYDFPIIDYLHFGFLWFLGRFTSDVLVVYNLYNLLTYPLTVLTAMCVLRWLKLSLPAAAVGGLLYAFLPYHQERYQYHYFLAAYWVVPLSLVPALAICKGDLPLFPLRADGTRARKFRSWSAGWPLLLGAVTASAGAYYAFFACAAYAFAGVYASVMFRTWRGALSAAWVIAPVVAVGAAYHYPTFLYQYRYGVNPITDRIPEEAEMFGLKLTHLVLPANDHNLSFFSRFRAMYSTPQRPVDGESAGSLGVIGAAGLVGLLAVVLFPRRRRWPESPLAGLVLFLILLATVGGFGSVFNLLVTAQIRAYNRISVLLGFLCLFAVMGWIDRFLLTRTGRWALIPWRYILWAGPLLPLLIGIVIVLAFDAMDRQSVVLDLSVSLSLSVLVALSALAIIVAARRASLGRVHRWCNGLCAAKLPIRYPAFVALFVLGFLDQTPFSWFRPAVIAVTDKHAERFRADKRFFQEIEEKNPGARVFCLPYSAFPEGPPVQKMPGYEHARGYLMTNTLTWSFGAVKRREADSWQREVVFEKPEEFLRRIVARGFDGLLIDGRGYWPRQADLAKPEPVNAVNPRESIHALYARRVNQNAARLPEVIHEDRKQFFLDLRPYRDALKALDPVLFERNVTEEREWIAPLWLKGFTVFDSVQDGDQPRWGTYDATLVFVNPTDRTRRIDFSFTIGIEVAGEFHFSFTGLRGLAGGEFDLEKNPDEGGPGHAHKVMGYAFHAIELPPGRSTLRIRCTPPPSFVPADHRKLCYFIKDFRLVEK